MRTKLAEMGRAMMGYGDWEMLPQHKRRWNSSVGSTILQKLGSTQSYEELPYENAIAAAAPPVNNETVEEKTIERAQRLFE